MLLNTNGRNALVNGLAGVVSHISLHEGVPDAAGSGELSGGGYARLPVTWSAAASGVRDSTAELAHTVPAGVTVTFYGLWSALSGGTFYGAIARTGVGEGRYGFGTVADVDTDVIQSAGHGLVDDMRVIVANVLAESLPAGLAEGTLYWVVGADTDTFKLAATQGGAAVNVTSVGELFWQRVVPETFASAGELVTAAGALDLSSVVI